MKIFRVVYIQCNPAEIRGNSVTKILNSVSDIGEGWGEFKTSINSCKRNGVKNSVEKTLIFFQIYIYIHISINDK